MASWPAQLDDSCPVGVIFTMMDAGKGNPSCLVGAAQLWASGNSSCWFTAHSSLDMTQIRTNTLVFVLLGKDTVDHIELWKFVSGKRIWYLEARSRYGILGIHVSNSRNSVDPLTNSKDLCWNVKYLIHRPILLNRSKLTCRVGGMCRVIFAGKYNRN